MRMTIQTLSILATILEDPARPRYGFELGEAAGLKSGTLYPALARLEEAGWLTSYWEDVEPHAELRRSGATLRVAREAEPWPAGAPPRAAVSAMGFGGINTHVVLERVAPRRRRALGNGERRLSSSAQDAELFLFAGSRADVAEQVAAVRAAAGSLSLAELGATMRFGLVQPWVSLVGDGPS